MNQDSLTPEKPATRAPVFFWITVSLLVILLLASVVVALLLVHEAKTINRSGGWGWLLVGGIYVAATTVVCAACAICTAISLFRRETHRRLSIAILVISCLVVLVFGPNLVRVVNRLYRQHEEAVRPSRSKNDAMDSSKSPKWNDWEGVSHWGTEW